MFSSASCKTSGKRLKTKLQTSRQVHVLTVVPAVAGFSEKFCDIFIISFLLFLIFLSKIRHTSGFIVFITYSAVLFSS